MRKSNTADVGASDEALLAGMAIGDEGAGVAFVRRYQRRVYGLALGLVGDHALAEDIAQEALLRAWRHAQVFDPRRASVATWVLTITRNLAVDALRLRRAVPTDPEKLIEMGTVSGEASPEERAESSEAGERPARRSRPCPSSNVAPWCWPRCTATRPPKSPRWNRSPSGRPRPASAPPWASFVPPLPAAA